MADSPPRRHRISTRPQGSPQTSPRTVRTNPASFDGTLRSTSIGGNASPRGMRLEIPSTSPNVVLKRTPQSLSYPSPASSSSNSVPPSSRTSTFSPSASTSSPTTPYESSLAAPLFYDNQKPAFTSLAATPNSSTTFASTSHLPAASASSSSQLSPRPLGDSMGFSPLSSGLNSARRKPGPPPLMLNRDRTWQGEDALAQPVIQGHPDGVYSERSAGPEGSNNFSSLEELGKSGGSSRRREDSSNSSPGKSREEERDTLSNLYSFSSPQYDSFGQVRGNEFVPESIPSAPSKIDSPPEAYADSEEPQPPSEDNTATSGFSFLSQSSEGAGLEPSSLHSSTTSSNSNSGSRDYTGLGLGLPFSMSAVQLSTDPSSSFLSTPNTRSSITSLEERNLGPESPVTDRSKLIGLGELATPRWTSSVLDRRWGPPSSENWQQENRRGSATGEEDYSILGGYSESVPRLPTFNDGEYSPTVTRPSGNRQISYESHNSSLSSSLANTSNPKQYPPIQKLQFPTESTLPIPGLIDFSLASQHHQALPPFSSSHRPSQNVDIAPSQQFHDRSTSPAYSLEAVSIDEREGEELQVSEGTPRKFEDAPVEGHEQWTRRRSAGAASSAPNTARDNTWTTAAARDVVGLGFEDESGLTPPTSAGFESLERRDSTGSIMKAPPSRRSSIGRTFPIDSGKGGHHRRQSASKSGFSHLPPSPATAIAQQPGSGSPLIPLEFPSATTPVISAPILSQRSHSQSSSSVKTPDFRRVSVHSHQSSPSIIAANILRQTRDFDFEGISVDVDMEAAAAADTGTAEALRKLDGLVSQKSSRIPSASGSLSNRNRTSSGSGLTPPAVRSGGESAEQRARRRTRSSTGGSLAPSEINSLFEENAQKSPPMPSSATGSPLLLHSPTFGSGPSLQPIITAIPVPRSPLYLQNSTMQQSQFLAYSPRPEANSTSLVSPSKRGSSSSASVNAGTSTSANSGTSRDSTSGTSLSGSSNNAARYLKTRRGSAGSDLSTQSSVDHLALKGDRAESRGELEALQQIPPVPPLPKDWESYRPSTAGNSSSSALNSPNLDAARRPSDGSFLEETATSTPQIAELERYLAASTSVLPPKSPSTRKWSISFGKRSPKATMKGSPSFMDLAQGDQSNFSTFSSQQSSSGPARRMAASSNDIAGLANRGDDTSRLRHSLRADLTRASSIPPRTRTASTSSSSTNRTTVANPALSVPISISVSTPGRSRSSLLSPRRTPSGIPFFSRKSSSISIPEANTTSASMKDIAVEEKSSSNGRKSILGLNFLRSTSSKKEKEKEKVIPTPVRQTMGGSTTRDTGAVDEFGRRGSVALKTSSLMTRKRGQTLSGEAEEAPRGLGLPPMQMSALSASTARRVDSLSHSTSNSSLSKKPVNTRLQPPLKSSRNVLDSPKDSSPTINGSPSSQAFPSSSDRANQVERLLDSGSTTPPLPPKSQTPTKIPRLYGRSSVTSPRLPASSIRSYASSAEGDGPPAVPASFTKPSRRSSTYGPSQPSDLSSSINFPSESDGDFAVNREPGLAPGERTLSTRRRLDADTSGIPRSQSNAGSGLSSSRTYRDLGDVASPPDSRAGTAIPRTHRRTSLLSSEESRTTSAIQTPRATALANQMRSSLSESTSSIASASVRRALSKPAEASRASDVAAIRRASAAPESSLPLSTTARNLPSKMAIPSRVSPFSATTASPGDTRRSRESTKSPAYDEEAKGDEEMAAYVRRQHTKKMAAGISADTIRKMFEFPDPTQPLPPLNSRDASALYSRFLSGFELEEIQSFKQIYFVGPNCEKKMATKDSPTNNFGYDDERGDYLLVPHDHILYRYETIDVLGKGSFGQVLQCRDHKTGDMVAIKIIRNKKRFHHQALVEIKVLENLVKWDPDEKHFVIRMVDSFTFRGHLCIVTELLSINLYELVKANSFAGFSTILIRRFTMQILASLSLLRHHRVVHCDLKPENILLKHPAKSAIKVIDFGSSCFEHEKVYTYIQSRFYRSPEVILGMNYHMAIDMWSLGCIIAEMFTGYPIFPGENEQEQLACIMEVMGLPDKYLVDRSSRKRLFFDSTGAPRPVVNSKGRRRRPATKTLAQVLKSDDELFVDFIAKCLIWDPERRLKPDAGARHPWMVAARKRAPSPIPPIRSARSSYAAASLSSSISTPLRKVGPSSGSISSNSSSFSSTLPSRIRTASTTSTRLPSKVSLGASAASASRFPVS